MHLLSLQSARGIYENRTADVDDVCQVSGRRSLMTSYPLMMQANTERTVDG